MATFMCPLLLVDRRLDAPRRSSLAIMDLPAPHQTPPSPQPVCMYSRSRYPQVPCTKVTNWASSVGTKIAA
uniref:Uncharacterized protein n=1 Tax=Oryza sativa subsp. japonica TaxID=39947 RepID=Q5VRE4_ORYSJ|nr:hypothetical protein [Oryza sativa Japonica Group]